LSGRQGRVAEFAQPGFRELHSQLFKWVREQEVTNIPVLNFSSL
jgi:hypothetical protein